MQILKQVAPAVSRVAVLYNPTQVTQVGLLAAIKTVAPSLGIQVSAASARDADEVGQVIDAFANTPGGGMVVLPNPITIANRGQMRSWPVTSCLQFTTYQSLHVRVD